MEDEKKKEEPPVKETKPEEKKVQEEPQEANPPGMITDAHFAAERLEKANEVQKKENDRMEKLLAEQTLNGRSSGTSGEKPAEETPKEYAEKAQSGDLNAKE